MTTPESANCAPKYPPVPPRAISATCAHLTVVFARGFGGRFHCDIGKDGKERWHGLGSFKDVSLKEDHPSPPTMSLPNQVAGHGL
jgi:hypothetical protein